MRLAADAEMKVKRRVCKVERERGEIAYMYYTIETREGGEA